MKLNIKDKTIDVDRNIEITKEEIVELIYNETHFHSIEVASYILDKIKEKERQEEEETFYKVGDRFNTTNGIHRLSTLGTNGAALVSEDCDICWASNYNVKDRFHITKEEFARITGNDPQFFTLFKF